MTDTIKFGTPQHFQMIEDLMRERGEETHRLRAALEHIVRECGALNKGPVAVEIALKALTREQRDTA